MPCGQFVKFQPCSEITSGNIWAVFPPSNFIFLSDCRDVHICVCAVL